MYIITAFICSETGVNGLQSINQGGCKGLSQRSNLLINQGGWNIYHSGPACESIKRVVKVCYIGPACESIKRVIKVCYIGPACESIKTVIKVCYSGNSGFDTSKEFHLAIAVNYIWISYWILRFK